MIIELLFTLIFYLNVFHWKDTPDPQLTPFNIIEGQHLDYNQHFQVLFREYAQVYDSTDNTMQPRTIGAIALGPSGNA